jgi:hypothetical protein
MLEMTNCQRDIDEKFGCHKYCSLNETDMYSHLLIEKSISEFKRKICGL